MTRYVLRISDLFLAEVHGPIHAALASAEAIDALQFGEGVQLQSMATGETVATTEQTATGVAWRLVAGELEVAS